MADFATHNDQAKHDEQLAAYLIDKVERFADWSIVACFYAAIHYFECRLSASFVEESSKHTETSMPVDSKGDPRMTAHQWRTKMIGDSYPQSTWKAFRKLRNSSETVRYLSHGIGTRTAFEAAPSAKLFNKSDAQQFLNRELQQLKRDFKVDLSEFVVALELSRSDVQAQLLVGKLLDNFTSYAEFQASKVDDFRRKGFTRSDIELLNRHLLAHGFPSI